tara:strand:- start:986 stop:1288 length:303 start_codon:yes stop_codon:yes gene_type:complete
MRTFLFLAIALWASIGYTDEWVASPTPLPQSIHSLGQILPPPTVIVEKTYPSPTLTYGLVPYYYNVPVVTERRSWFLRREKRITYQPQIQWYYQPFWIVR